jgi:hypothetical protein
MTCTLEDVNNNQPCKSCYERDWAFLYEDDSKLKQEEKQNG